MPHEKDTKLLRRETLIPGLLVLLALGVLAYSLTGLGFAKDAQAIQTAKQPTYDTKSTGEFSASDAQIKLTPKGMRDGAFVIAFSANTHGITLSEHDLSEAVTLLANGQEYQPISASVLRGHHNNGELVFGLDQAPASFTVTITGVPSHDTRTYEWTA